MESEKRELIKELESKSAVLMKFGNRENLQLLQKGQLYMKNLQYFINLEKTTDDEDVGDKYDGQLPIYKPKLQIHLAQDKVLELNGSVATLNFGYKKSPVFCMFILDQRNHIASDIKSNGVTLTYKFSDEQRNRISNFGDSVLIISDPELFLKRVKKALSDNDILFLQNRVKYYEDNSTKHFKEIYDGNEKACYWKRQKYAYQQEYRLFCYNIQIEDYISINIGDISDITELVELDSILNSTLEIYQEIYEIED